MLLIDTAKLNDSREETYINSIRNLGKYLNTVIGINSLDEVHFITEYTNYLLDMGVPPKSIGIITPYYAQVT